MYIIDEKSDRIAGCFEFLLESIFFLISIPYWIEMTLNTPSLSVKIKRVL